MLRYMAILTLVLGMANTSTLFANDTDHDSSAVRSAAESLLAAGNMGDIEAFEQFFLADNTVFGPDGGPRSMFKSDSARSEFKAGMRYKLRWRNLDVKIYGTTAITTGYATGAITYPDGSAKLGSWRTSLVWIKTADGKWKVAHDHTSELFPEQSDHTS